MMVRRYDFGCNDHLLQCSAHTDEGEAVTVVVAQAQHFFHHLEQQSVSLDDFTGQKKQQDDRC